jgi:hypothetical protein
VPPRRSSSKLPSREVSAAPTDDDELEMPAPKRSRVTSPNLLSSTEGTSTPVADVMPVHLDIVNSAVPPRVSFGSEPERADEETLLTSMYTNGPPAHTYVNRKAAELFTDVYVR